MANEAFYEEAINSLVNHDKDAAEDVAKRAIAAGVSPQDIMQNGFVVGIRRVGDQFDEGEVYLPELMLAAAAMEGAMEICNAALPAGESETRGVIVMGTVEGDIHDIGKAIVCAYMRANGYEVHDLGRDVPVDAFVDKAEEVNADVIGASALLTATMRMQAEIIGELKDRGMRDKVKFVVGGAPCTQEYADSIGADAYAADASDGVKKIETLLGIK
jgi:corrinoid protein of di/trimethylamine methyltransferase